MMELSFPEFISYLPWDEDVDIRPALREVTLLYLSLRNDQVAEHKTKAHVFFDEIHRVFKILKEKLPPNRSDSNSWKGRGRGDSDYYLGIIYGWGRSDKSKRGEVDVASAAFYYFFRYVPDANYFVRIAEKAWSERSLTFQRFIYAKCGGERSDNFQQISTRFRAPPEVVRRKIREIRSIREPHEGLTVPRYLSKADVDALLGKNPFDSVWLSPHNHHSIPLYGRQRELDRLDSFISSPETFLILPLIAASGAGKTRLVSEWMKPFVTGPDANEWDAGFLTSRDPTLWSKEKWPIDRNTLIVIDYTFAYIEVAKEIVRRVLKEIVGNVAPRIRLLVIDHIYPEQLLGDLLWNKLFERKDELDLARVRLILDPIELRAERAKSALLAHVIAASASLGSSSYSINDPLVIEAAEHLSRMGGAASGGNDAALHPLFAALMGQVIRESGKTQLGFRDWNRRDLIEEYFTDPLRFPWKVWADDTNRRQGLVAGALVSAATLRQGVPTRRMRDFLADDADAVIQYANRIISSEDESFIRPFVPDILGETFVLKFLKTLRKDTVAYATFVAMLAHARDIPESDEVAINVLGTIIRLARNLANDEQNIKAIHGGWDVLCDFLKPERFESGSPLRQAISYAISDVLAQLAEVGGRLTERSTRYSAQNEHTCADESRRLVDLLNDIRSDLETQFSTEDVKAATTRQQHIFLSVSAASRFVEFAESFDSNAKQTFLDDVALALVRWNRETAAHFAAAFGFTKILVSVLTISEYDQETLVHLLILACESGYTETAALLLDRHTRVDQRTGSLGWTALMAACQGDHAETARLLLDRRAAVDQPTIDGGITPLMIACQYGHTKTAALLLDRGAVINRATANKGVTALMIACQYDHIETVKLLLDSKADFNQGTVDNGETALMIACYHRHIEIVRLLLDWGATVDQGTTDKNETALMVACVRGHTEIAILLLDRHAEINQATSDIGLTPLIAACLAGNTETAAMLLDRKADINQGTTDGWTPLMAACENGWMETAMLLLDHNAKVDLLTEDSNSALSLASENGHTEIVDLLLDRSA